MTIRFISVDKSPYKRRKEIRKKKYSTQRKDFTDGTDLQFIKRQECVLNLDRRKSVGKADGNLYES